MMINCKELYSEIVKEIRQEVDGLPFTPSYVCYLVGEDKASEKYVSLKHKTSDEAGVNCIIKKLTKEQFIKEMGRVRLGHETNKYQPLRAMLQLPADKECVELFNEMVVEGAIIDVDHLGDDVLLDMWSGNFNRMPGTPRGIIAVLFNELGSLSGKKISIIGSRSKTTGRFLIPMLQHFNATVSMYHSRSIINHGEFRDCDAVISCVGSPRMIQASHLSNKRSQVLIDVGVGFIDGKVVGDFSEDVRGSHRYTPYVGGVGMLTRAMLIRNVLDSFLMIGGVK